MVSEKRTIALDHQRSLVARAARTSQGAIANNVTKEPDFLPNPLLPATKAEMAIPISIGETVLGVLDVQADTVNRFTNEDVAIQTTLAQQVATSLQNIQNFTQAQHQAEREAKLNLISQQIQNADSVEAVLQITVRELGDALRSKNIRVVLRDRELAGNQPTNR
jgi:GAF domain-containing protein